MVVHHHLQTSQFLFQLCPPPPPAITRMMLAKENVECSVETCQPGKSLARNVVAGLAAASLILFSPTNQ
ncbi:hypothetical protein CRG98_011887, partial [Punica granatum]